MIIHIYLVFYLTLKLTHGYKCGDCYCAAWMNTLSCSGKNISSFPAIENPSWISHVDIISTSISSIQPLRDWPQGFTADVRNNYLLPCEQVLDLQREKRNALIITDCDDDRDIPLPLIPIVQLPDTPTDWLNLLILFPFLSVVALIIYSKKQFGTLLKNGIKYQTYEGCDQLTNVSPSTTQV